MKCRILKNKKCIITQNYSENHQAIDVIGENPKLDYITAHSDGKIIIVQDGLNNIPNSTGNQSYGNYIKIEHQNGYATLYAHMQKNLLVKRNETVKKGQVIGYMSNSGNTNGSHLHFEVWKDNKRINPLNYINKDFELSTINNPNKELKYQLGTTVKIKDVYISSTSNEPLKPAITEGKITKIIQNARNPYLLDNGLIGWVNDQSIISEIAKNKYLQNKTYTGFSLVDALKQINIDSSYNYRSNLAKINNIENYTGTSIQNTILLNLLKQGKLKY